MPATADQTPRIRNLLLEEDLAAAGSDAFFSTPQLEQRLDLARFLLERGDQAIALIAPSGAGKTSFLDELARRAPEEWRLSRLDGAQFENERQLIDRLAVDFGAPSPADAPDARERLRCALAAMQESGRRAVALLDNAHLLGAASRTHLAELAGPATEAAGLRLVLAAEPTTTELIPADDRAGTPADMSSHPLDLAPLTPEQTCTFLRHVFAARGVPGSLTADTVAAIHARSGGLPGEVLAAARSMLGELAESPAAADWRQALSGWPRPLLAGVVVAACAAAGAWLALRGEDPPPSVSRELTLPAAAAPSPVEPPPPGRGEPALRPRERSLAARAGRPPASPTPATLETSPAVEATPAVPDLLPERSPVRLPVAEPAPAPAAAAPREAPRGPDWFLSQHPDQYVLQVFGVRERDAAMRFLEQARLGTRLAWFATTHENKAWYVVCYGLYPNRDAARAATADLPEGLREFRPWARSIANIREAIALAPSR
jgi:hypothetical protein